MEIKNRKYGKKEIYKSCVVDPGILLIGTVVDTGINISGVDNCVEVRIVYKLTQQFYFQASDLELERLEYINGVLI